MTAQDVAQKLPTPEELERRCLAMSALDAVLSPESHYRFFTFDPALAAQTRMASMRDGCGDCYNVIFGPFGSVVRAFDHEDELSPWGRPGGRIDPAILRGFPAPLRSVIDDPAFRTEGAHDTDLTFCTWWPSDASSWTTGPVEGDGGAAWMLEVALDGTPVGYCSFAADYYAVLLSPGSVAPFYELRPATTEMITALDSQAETASIVADLAAMGYPVDSSLGGTDSGLRTIDP